MITPYKDRALQWSDLVCVYRNLNRDSWSVRALSGPDKGRVIGHADELTLLRPWFVVSEKSRQRALSQGQRNVHAWVTGTVVADPVALHGPVTRVRYNPYRCGHFTLGTNVEARVYSAPEARFTADGAVLICGRLLGDTA